MLDVDAMLTMSFADLPLAWGPREAILYALGAGCGIQEERFLRDPGLAALPTLATIACYVKTFDPSTLGLDYAGLVHTAQSVELHRPLPVAAKVMLSKRVTAVWDRGADKGAVVEVETRIRDAATGGSIAILVNEMLARRNGGFGGAPPPAVIDPNIDEGASRAMCTRQEQALLFRLSGDWNPLHSDPDVARNAGFPGPILHGLCIYAICCRALILEHDLDASVIRHIGARFAAPVFPGETIVVTSRRSGDTIDFVAAVGERKVVRAGRCRIEE